MARGMSHRDHHSYHQSLLRGLLATAAFLIAGALAAQTSGGDKSPPASDIAPVFFENDFITALDYGLICALKRSGTTQDGNTETGSTHILAGTPSFAVRTTTIPAQLGLSFGVRVRAVGPETLHNVRISLRHPPTGAGSHKTTFEHWPATITPDNPPTSSTFTFEHAHELALGRWIFEAHIGDQRLYHVEFTVVDPADAAHLRTTCDAAPATR